MREIPSDVLLVGAGPIGLELAVALKAAGVDYVHLEAGAVGATIAWYAPQTRFFSSPERIAIAGVPLVTLDQSKATREEYLAYLRAVALQFDLDVHTFERVDRLEPTLEGDFRLRSQSNAGTRRWRARRVVLAIGDMHQPRRLGIPGEDLPHVSHYFGDPHRHFRRHVLIVGGKNSAVEAAIRCFRAGARVTVAYRGAGFDPERVKFWLLPEIRALARDGLIGFLPGTTPREILPGRVVLERLTALGGETGEAIEVEADDVLLLTGYEQDSDLFLQAGVTLEGPGRRPRHDERTMETDVPGLYVAGTGVAGTQVGGVKHFIETSHVHVDRIVAALTGRPAPGVAVPAYELPES